MQQTISIGAHYCGPPRSANGGYACGVTAAGLRQPVQVTLHAPPPLDVPLVHEHSDAEATLRAGDTLIASARTVSDDVTPPPPVPYDEAVGAAERFRESDLAGYRTHHPYPECFTCGPSRDRGGLRLFPGTVSPGLTAWPWTPSDDEVTADGALAAEVVWAALDCPSGLAWLSREPDLSAFVLGRMTGAVHRRPRPGEELIVVGAADDADGRKLSARTAIWSADGAELLAASRTLWFVLSEEQRRAFGAAGA